MSTYTYNIHKLYDLVNFGLIPVDKIYGKCKSSVSSQHFDYNQGHQNLGAPIAQ